MESIFDLFITSIISIFTLFIGRYWGFHDLQINHDKEVLKRILECLPSNGSILFIREHDFGESFIVDELNDFFKFEALSKRPEVLFLDNRIEVFRIDLQQNINKFISLTAVNTFPINTPGKRVNKIKDQYEFKNKNDYLSIREEINSLANKVCESYDKLVIF